MHALVDVNDVVYASPLADERALRRFVKAVGLAILIDKAFVFAPEVSPIEDPDPSDCIAENGVP
ncbi:hypothetical protein GsuE55_00140 [Geobacillus subterraneus]|uniref:Uncharacterized protein n=1 Tax=Geobacillus subterraneus TaxID=129338 RepID=A0A679FTU2_9BACL|nr:hypothetical protein B4113_0562 [Geobacillus sp. B4113_201601]BBW95181.1 hypothetical protein GsuE55_00140 [Geobacillus subterraneus]